MQWGTNRREIAFEQEAHIARCVWQVTGQVETAGDYGCAETKVLETGRDVQKVLKTSKLVKTRTESVCLKTLRGFPNKYFFKYRQQKYTEGFCTEKWFKKSFTKTSV